MDFSTNPSGRKGPNDTEKTAASKDKAELKSVAAARKQRKRTHRAKAKAKLESEATTTTTTTTPAAAPANPPGGKLGETSLPAVSPAVRPTADAEEIWGRLKLLRNQKDVDLARLVKNIEANWTVKIENLLPTGPRDLRPKIKGPEPQKLEKVTQKLSRAGYTFEPYRADWDASSGAGWESERWKDGAPPVYNKGPYMLANPEWDFKNPLDWGKDRLVALAVLSEISKNQKDVVMDTLAEKVDGRIKVKYGNKSPEFLAKDVLAVLEEVLAAAE